MELANCQSTVQFKFNVHDVKSVFKKADLNKSPEPDGITGWVLNICAEQLNSVFFDIFSMSLGQRRVPKLWKESIIDCLAVLESHMKSKEPSPVVLTSMVMKSFEKWTFQIRYRSFYTSCSWRMFASLYFISWFTHLECPDTHTRLWSIDFSSAFNTIKPNVSAKNLLNDFNIYFSLTHWILDYSS